MNEFKGTKGMWRVVENGGRMVGVMAGDEWVVYKAGQDRMSTEELEANAALIAGSPRLYAALARLTQAAQDANVGYLDAAVAEGWEALEEALGE